MNIRVEPGELDSLARELERSHDGLAEFGAPAEADAGPSGPAVNTTLAGLVRAAAGLAEQTWRTTGDLLAGKATYTEVDSHNAEQIHRTAPR